ncbi:BREX-2 system adenine-specific DNA-methyltransferase PglX [Actinomadura craniellae]|uniref:site-specific DNA-methyltransferase (adenine-specific) n=1 Tax=Actinomadura craniellae TaxID=2231787 RepID=A0A365H184_9ACTN|nr:BREX-2 system adenine-specific DNA-methyltransferase PglX [Actinomadura craniellae]RAY12852.1 BREX-2 system adenine-specific DNA-methyltransferase PglX [Actinomadura craniellae]
MARRKSAERTLVTDLRHQVTLLVDDLRARSDTDESLRDKLVEEHQRALKAERIAVNYTDWREDRLTQIAVAWILGTVFVRYCEDNELVEHPWISGPGDRLKDAEDRHAAYFRAHPEKNDRDWLLAAFDHLSAAHPAVAGLFDRAHNPLWEADPGYEAAADLLKFWRTPGADGEIPYTFRGADTRFLGDLYQHLSDHAQKTYALLQTPEFVEEFILDLTLTPALDEFGLQPVWPHTPAKWTGPVNDDGEAIGLRTIDPACGSGHFLLGLFHRVLAAWAERAPALPRWDLVRLTLHSVHGCDKNPFAAAIARFRLLIAALDAAGEKRLDQAPAFPINIAVGDSLIHGRDALGVQGDLLETGEHFHFATEDVKRYIETCDALGLGSYHAVVGNPPYIIVRDKQESDNYRRYYPDACGGAYALSAPFAQRIFDLATRSTDPSIAAGFTGQITANSFMKREFGKKLIERFFPKIRLTHVIDTSGAWIPGHGTPTAILAGRNSFPDQSTTIRAVLSVRGEPGQPDNAADGFVWTAIVNQVDRPGSESPWVTVSDLPRPTLAKHPWSLSGGGAGELFNHLEGASASKLRTIASETGFGATTKEDGAYLLGDGTLRRAGVPTAQRKPFIEGVMVRDYAISPEATFALWPYHEETLEAEELAPIQALLWPYRTNLSHRTVFGRHQEDRGLTWFEYSEFAARRFRLPFSITFAFVATHNHFVLDRGGKVFNRSAPVIKLPESASEDDHLGLLGLLNSSTACFWLKQVSQDKGNRGGERGTGRYAWESFFEFTGTKIQNFPVPTKLPLSLSKELDQLATHLASAEPSSVIAKSTPTRESLEAAKREYTKALCQMIALQEELDWHVYGIYGILSESDLTIAISPANEHPQDIALGERAFEIVQARHGADDEAVRQWYVRHGSKPILDIPEAWPSEYAKVVQARIDLIEQRPNDIGLLERPEYKRRWSTEPWEAKERTALVAWILDRCEREELWFVRRDGLLHPRTMTVGELADRFRDDEDMNGVARLYATDHLGKRDLPLAGILAAVLKDEHVPYLAALRYKDSGLRKRAEWEKTWELQRQEDREGRRLRIPVPPKYASADFRKPAYWSHRGKLDVPKERFVSYPGAARHSDDPLLLGWAGWDHKDQAQALVNLVNDRAEEQWVSARIVPLLAGLAEVMPWVRQWHGEYDAEWEGNPAEEFGTFLETQLSRHQVSARALREWRPSKEFLKGAKA